MPKATETPWTRTCQECGHQQSDEEPEYGKPLPSTYSERVCNRCKSPALDYGTNPSTDSDNDGSDDNDDNDV